MNLKKYPNFPFITNDNVVAVLKEEMMNSSSSSDKFKQLVSQICGSVKEIGDGNLNYVWLVDGSPSKLLVKQAVPYIRVVPDWDLNEKRALFEAEALQLHHSLVPSLCPELYHLDRDRFALVEEFFENGRVLRHLLCDANAASTVNFRGLASRLASYLSGVAVGTSALSLSTTERSALVAKFTGNVDMVCVTEKVIFRDPYNVDEPLNKHNPLIPTATIDRLQSDPNVRLTVERARRLFVSSTEAIIHGDLHTGSIMINTNNSSSGVGGGGESAEDLVAVKIIDFEFAMCGPMAWDVGCLFANLLFSYFRHEALGNESVREQIKSLIQSVWTGFTANVTKAVTPGTVSQDSFFQPLFLDVAAFVAVELVRRVIGVAHVEDLESIEDVEVRARAENACLLFATDLLQKPASFSKFFKQKNN